MTASFALCTCGTLFSFGELSNQGPLGVDHALASRWSDKTPKVAPQESIYKTLVNNLIDRQLTPWQGIRLSSCLGWSSGLTVNLFLFWCHHNRCGTFLSFFWGVECVLLPLFFLGATIIGVGPFFLFLGRGVCVTPAFLSWYHYNWGGTFLSLFFGAWSVRYSRLSFLVPLYLGWDLSFFLFFCGGVCVTPGSLANP